MPRPKRLPVVLTPQETMRLLNQPNRKCPTGLRNYTIMAVMWRAGLRVSEAIALQPVHIDFKHGLIRVVEGKGKKDRTLYVDPFTIDVLQKWLEVRKSITSKHKHLFVTLQGEPLDDSYLRRMVKREAKQAGIEKDVHPHTLRHSFATDLLNDGFTLVEVQDALGHANLSTTQVYLHVNPVHMARRMQERVVHSA
jgi:integrase/recombinase XerD